MKLGGVVNHLRNIIMSNQIVVESMFKTHLSEVARLVNAVLTSDSFTENVNSKFLYEGVTAYPSRRGKYLRPALLLWSCGVFDENIEKAAKIAAGTEIYHIWTLVHDDIIDNDNLRRGAPSVHALIRDRYPGTSNGQSISSALKFGSDMAILSGDIQQAWANHLMIRSLEDGIEPEILVSVLRRLNQYVNPTLISGEAMDVEFSLMPVTDITPNMIEQMLIQKTGVLFRFAAESGAMAGLKTGDINHESVRILGNIAEKAALAFQMKDDILGMIGNPIKLGKPVGSDYREGKRTLLVSEAARRLRGGERQFFLKHLGNPDTLPHDVERAYKLLAKCGAIESVEEKLDTLIQESRSLLGTLPDNKYKSLLDEWLTFLSARES